MTLKHGFQMWQLNIPNPWEISSVVFWWFFFFLIFITKCPLPFFMLSLQLSLSLPLYSTLQQRLLCFGTYILMREWRTIISSLDVAAEQCKVSLHLILVTKRCWTAACWVPHATGCPVCVCVDVSICWCIYALQEHDPLNVILVKTCNFGH